MTVIKNINDKSQKLLKSLVQDTTCKFTKCLLMIEINPSYFPKANGGFCLTLNRESNDILKHFTQSRFCSYEDYVKSLLKILEYWVNLQLDNNVLTLHYIRQTLLPGVESYKNNYVAKLETWEIVYFLDSDSKDFMESEKEITVSFALSTECSGHCVYAEKSYLRHINYKKEIYIKKLFKVFEEKVLQHQEKGKESSLIKPFSGERKYGESYNFTIRIEVDIL